MGSRTEMERAPLGLRVRAQARRKGGQSWERRVEGREREVMRSVELSE
jgi:hypothetical protein